MSNFLETVRSYTSNTGPESEVPHFFDGENLRTNNDHEYEHSIQTNNATHENYSIPQYEEDEVTVKDWLQSIFSNPLQMIINYLVSLFPIAKWILHYNGKWLYGDLVAGITVGIVLVPQSMSYATLAGLAPQFGLYSSFVGVFIYSFFATSKDVSIGPVAVMSSQVGKVIAKIQADYGTLYEPATIATVLSLICGGIAAGLGVLRLGFILEFISIPAVMGFMSGSALNIISGQVPALMGFPKAVNTRDATYMVIINSLKALPQSTSDAAFGLIPLFILYLWNFVCGFGQKRWPKLKWYFFYLQQLRNAIVIIVASAISWGIVHPKKVAFNGPIANFKPPISIIGTVPSGLQDVGVMKIPDGLPSALGSEIPVSTIILLLEHIAISKSFGRVNDYKVIPDQEVIAIGVTNLIGTFFNAYPATGSFSRSALKAKCGVRTPVAGLFTGAVVLLALYTLTSSFFYIPKATLSAVIIHAVSDLVANYKVTWSFWRISPIDCGIFLIGLIITIFVTIEAGIYFAIASSCAVLLFRVAKPNGQFLGRTQVAEIINPIIVPAENDSGASSINSNNVEIHQVLSTEHSNYQSVVDGKDKESATKINTIRGGVPPSNVKIHTRWVPLSKANLNSGISVTPPPPGVIVFKPIESFTYPNASRQIDIVSDEAKRLTRRGKPYDLSDKGSRPWNDPGPLYFPWTKKSELVQHQQEDTRPLLRLIHFDFSVVANVDVTSIQALVDLRKAMNNYADREVEFHFSGILSPWIKRGLINAGFGIQEDGLIAENTYVNIVKGGSVDGNGEESDLESGKFIPAIDTNTPFFHLDIPNY
ncbi:Sulfate permease 1 [Spathaspora sp. JA1]|nr:Sulfate permease 1 [Spathaspora sp. JA1]